MEIDSFIDQEQLVSLEETYSNFLNGVQIKTLKVDDTRDRPSSKNYFLTKPQGIIIQDSYNNFAYPIRPLPRIDTNKLELTILTKRFRELYLQFQNNVLPWHYLVEMIGSRYYVYNTRPITMRYPLKHNEILKREKDLPFNVTWNNETKDFFEKRRFNIEEAIHVCILGDTNIDVYPKNFYKVIGQFCIRPFIHWFKLPQSSKTRTFALNTGSKFNFEYLFKFLYK